MLSCLYSKVSWLSSCATLSREVLPLPWHFHLINVLCFRWWGLKYYGTCPDLLDEGLLLEGRIWSLSAPPLLRSNKVVLVFPRLQTTSYCLPLLHKHERLIFILLWIDWTTTVSRAMHKYFEKNINSIIFYTY